MILREVCVFCPIFCDLMFNKDNTNHWTERLSEAINKDKNLQKNSKLSMVYKSLVIIHESIADLTQYFIDVCLFDMLSMYIFEFLLIMFDIYNTHI